MAFPGGWSKYCEITVPSSQVGSGGVTSFTVLLTEANLPSDIFSVARSDGGDIRFTVSGVQVACDVIAFDAGTTKAIIRVGPVSLSSVVDNTLKVWYGNATATTPSASSTYGRYNAYDSSWAGYWPLTADLNNRKSASHTLTNNGTVTVGGVSGKVGNATEFNGTSQSLTVASGVLSGEPCTLMAWVRNDDLTDFSARVSVSCGESGAYNGFSLSHNKSGANHRYWASTHNGSSDPASNRSEANGSATGWQFQAGVYKDDHRQLDLGSTQGSANTTATTAPTPAAFAIGMLFRGNLNRWDGGIQHVQAHNAERAQAWRTTEYNSTNAPASFATAGTPQDVPDYDSAIASLSTTSYWKLQGDANDEIGSNDLTNNGATFGADGPWTGATAATFDGVNDYLTSALSLSGNFTVNAWCSLSANGNYPMVCTWGNYATPDLRFNAGSRFPEFGFANSATAIVGLDEWHMLTGVRNGSTGTLYLDGVQIATGDASAHATDLTVIDIGRRFDSFWFPGSIARVSLHPVVLTQEQILLLHASQSEGGGSGPATYNETASGGSLVGGSATRSVTYRVTPSGGSIVGGSTSPSKITSISTSGGAVLGGQAIEELVEATATYNETMSGGAVVGSSASVSVIKSETMTGGIEVDGQTIPFGIITITSTGGSVVGGQTSPNYLFSNISIGGARLGSSATITLVKAANPSVDVEVTVAPTITATTSVRPTITAAIRVRERYTAAVAVNAV